MKAIVLLALVSVCVALASASKCYTCDETADPKLSCADLKDTDIKTCDPATLVNCFKHGEEDKRVHGCTDLESTAYCAAKIECEVCTGEACNSSASVLASAALVAVSAILLKMYN